MSARGTLSQLETALAFLVGIGVLFMVLAGGLGVAYDHANIETLSAALFWLGLLTAVFGVVLWLFVVRPWTQFDDINIPKDTGHHHGAEAHHEAEAPAEVHEAPAVVHEAPAAKSAPVPAVRESIVPAVAPAAEVAVVPDDLTKIEGIGPKISGVLQAAGITTFAQLARKSPAELDQIVRDGGITIADAGTWQEQAALAAKGDWAGLEALQGELVAGRRVTAAAEPEVVTPDDLTKIEGIGPKISSVLQAAGILTFAQLAARQPQDIETVIREAGIRLGDPATWPEQAALAASGDWDGLEALQGSLKGGRRA